MVRSRITDIGKGTSQESVAKVRLFSDDVRCSSLPPLEVQSDPYMQQQH